MLGSVSNTTPEPQGYIALFNLGDWWRNSFTDEERQNVLKAFQLFGEPKDALVGRELPKDVVVSGDLISCGNDRILVVLTGLAAWFNNPRDRNLAHKIMAKAEEYVGSENNILAIHFFYQAKMELFYKERKNPTALMEAIDACLKQIAISEKAAAAFRNEDSSGTQLPMHAGYEQLCIILEKQRKFDEAIKYACLAKKQGWNGEWDRRVERCKKKLERSLKS